MTRAKAEKAAAAVWVVEYFFPGKRWLPLTMFHMKEFADGFVNDRKSLGKNRRFRIRKYTRQQP